MRMRVWAAGAAVGLALSAATIGWGAASALSAARDTAVGVVELASLSVPQQAGLICKRGWHFGHRHGRPACIRDRKPGVVLTGATCSPTSECPPVCRYFKFTNSAGTSWVTPLLCDVPAKGPVVCVASGQATSRPDPGSVYLCRRR